MARSRVPTKRANPTDLSFRGGLLLVAAALVAAASGSARAADPDAEAAYYRVDAIESPKDAFLEVGGLAYSPDGTLYVATRRGEIWAYRKQKGEGARYRTEKQSASRAALAPDWSLFAEGLHEPTGLHAFGNGDLAVAQRPELTRVRDSDRDGRADRFDTLTAAFGISGNYHEYHFGPVRDRAGNLYGTLNLAHVNWPGHVMGSSAAYRGWAYKLTPKGEFIPLASGLRSPAGIGVSPAGEIFIADNQGDWMATSPLFLLKPGSFFGHPCSLRWQKGYAGPEEPCDQPPESLIGRRPRPAVWFVYGVAGHSPGEPVWDTTRGRFGPFAGQILVGDQTKSFITRVVLEKIDGEYQGAVFPFRKGFGSGIVRMVFDRDGSLVAGGTGRGWGATGGKIFALDRVSWTGKVPFEVQAMSIAKGGFELTFTKPVDKAAAGEAGAYAFQHWDYRYSRAYGSPHVDTKAAAATAARVSADGRKVTLEVPRLETGRVWELKMRDLKASDGTPLLHDTAWYTLNRLRVK